MTDSPVNVVKGSSTLINQVPALLYTNFNKSSMPFSVVIGGSLLLEPESLAN
jgi:hypothetical protein